MNNLQQRFIKDANLVFSRLSTWEQTFIKDMTDLMVNFPSTSLSPGQNKKLNEINTKVVRLLTQKADRISAEEAKERFKAATYEGVTGRQPLPKSDEYEEDDFDDGILF